MWRREPYSFSADVWALGCILHELCSLQPLFAARTNDAVRSKVRDGGRREAAGGAGWALLVERCGKLAACSLPCSKRRPCLVLARACIRQVPATRSECSSHPPACCCCARFVTTAGAERRAGPAALQIQHGPRPLGATHAQPRPCRAANHGGAARHAAGGRGSGGGVVWCGGGVGGRVGAGCWSNREGRQICLSEGAAGGGAVVAWGGQLSSDKERGVRMFGVFARKANRPAGTVACSTWNALRAVRPARAATACF